MKYLWRSQQALRTAVLGTVLAVVGAACQPATPSLVPASFQTTIDSFAYSTTTPSGVSGYGVNEASFVAFGLSDPLAHAIGGTPDLWPESGMYSMGVAIGTTGPDLSPGTYVVGTGTDEVRLYLDLFTWEERRRDSMSGDGHEVHWTCQTATEWYVAGAKGTVTIANVSIAAGKVTAIEVSWDLSCQRWIDAYLGPVGGSPPRHWGGHASFGF